MGTIERKTWEQFKEGIVNIMGTKWGLIHISLKNGTRDQEERKRLKKTIVRVGTT